MPRLLAAFPAVAGLQQIVDRIGGGVDVYSALGVTLQHRPNVMSFAAQVHSGAASSSQVALAMAARNSL